MTVGQPKPIWPMIERLMERADRAAWRELLERLGLARTRKPASPPEGEET